MDRGEIRRAHGVRSNVMFNLHTLGHHQDSGRFEVKGVYFV